MRVCFQLCGNKVQHENTVYRAYKRILVNPMPIKYTAVNFVFTIDYKCEGSQDNLKEVPKEDEFLTIILQSGYLYLIFWVSVISLN